MPIEPGTLAGFDQLLTISQEAVNAQLEVLYNTEVDPPIKDGPTHLINHELHFHAKKKLSSGKEVIAKDGLDGWILCPKVEFGGQKVTDEVDKYRLAVIRFKFRKAEDWELDDNPGKNRDSVFRYKEVVDQDEDGRDVFEWPEVVINGWEISWRVLIDSQNIQDVMSELINPANSSNSQICLTKDAKKGLKAVDSSNFQVSTIFCAMQSSRLIQSFELLDETGKIPEDAKTTDGNTVNVKELIEGFQNTLIQKFINSNTSKPGVPTPDNPFVLGYSVSQEKADLATVNPAAAKANLPTPDFFVPKYFRCNLSPLSSFCQGTLNYCMLTHRAKKPPYHKENGLERVVDYGIDGAGRFKENVFSRMKTRATPGSAEGALFFCQDIFVNHWIGSSVAPLFLPDSWETTQSIAKLVKDNYKQVNRLNELYFGSEVTNPTKELSQNNVYRVENKFNSPRRIIARNFLDDPTESLKLEYGSSLEIKYENLYPLRDDDDDLKRRLKFTIGSYTKIKIKIYRRLVTSHVGDAFEMTGRFLFTGEIKDSDYMSDDNWEEALVSEIWLNYQHTFEIGTSPKNRGSFTIENASSQHLKSDGSLDARRYGPPNDRTPGVWQKTETKNWADWFSGAFEGELAGLVKVGEGAAANGEKVFKGALDDLANSLGATVILPAGDVFMFKGISCDKNYNVFTTICYDTPTSGKVTAHSSSDMSHTAWQKPQPPTKKK
ncbi:hypothetical protein H9Q69_004848 [Fusarium xylarioides]|nr:hypothetical protein H9Q69_004848 [Fusarium xylarioides]